MLVEWLMSLGGDLPGANLTRYLSVRIGAAATTSFIVTLILIPQIVKLSRSLRFGDREGKSDSDTLEQLHAAKRSTPVLGGLGILAATLCAVLLWGKLTNFYVILTGLVLLSLGACGFVDDFTKTFAKGRKDGLTPRQKLLWQGLTAVIAGFLLVDFHGDPEGLLPSAFADAHQPEYRCELVLPIDTAADEAFEDAAKRRLVEGTTIYPPFFKDAQVPLGAPLFILFAVLVIVGSSNAVNLTDGLDGLAANCSIFVAGVYTVLSYISGRSDWCAYLGIPYVPGVGEVSVVCAALAGACAGFLWFNCHPAEIFMGDTGSLPLGGGIGLIALMTKHDLLLVVAGGVFVAEALSVMTQVAVYKATRKRVLRCAPLHHHFEFGGWKETKVVQRFTIVAAFLALAALTTLKLR